MKKLLFLLLPLILFSKVYAAEIPGVIDDNQQVSITLPDAAQCFNSSGTALNGSFFYGNNLINDGIYGSSGYSCDVDGGGIFSFTLNTLTDANQLYSIAIYLGNNSGTGAGLVQSIGIADSTYVARNQIVYSGSNATLFSSRTLSNIGQFAQPTGNAGSPLTHYYYSIYYVVFSSHSTSNSFAIKFNWNGTPTGNSYLFGYHLEPLGSTNQLTSSQVSSIVNGATSNLATQSSINQLQRTENEIKSEMQEANNKIDEVNDNLTNDNTSGAEDTAGGFFNDFTTDTHGLTAVITAPLSLITSITSSSCSPLVIPLPYVDKDLTLPCMGTIYSNYFGSFLSIYQMITFGIIAYWVLVRIFNLVKDFKNPDHDEIEVLDL